MHFITNYVCQWLCCCYWFSDFPHTFIIPLRQNNQNNLQNKHAFLTNEQPHPSDVIHLELISNTIWKISMVTWLACLHTEYISQLMLVYSIWFVSRFWSAVWKGTFSLTGDNASKTWHRKQLQILANAYVHHVTATLSINNSGWEDSQQSGHCLLFSHQQMQVADFPCLFMANVGNNLGDGFKET